MTTRENLTPMLREAHRILDLVKRGFYVPDRQIEWALVVTGDLG